jgi:hypothetical protein
MLRILTTVFLLALTSACNQNRQAEEPAASGFPEELISDCKEAIYPLAYLLFKISPKTGDEGILTGLSVFSFHEILSDSDKDQMMLDLNSHYNESGKSDRNTITQETEQWCRFYFHVDQLQNQLSTEEVLARLYSSSKHDYLFSEYSERAMFMIDGVDAIDRVASLSSSESNDIINRWVIFASQLSPEKFQAEINSSRKIVAN